MGLFHLRQPEVSSIVLYMPRCILIHFGVTELPQEEGIYIVSKACQSVLSIYLYTRYTCTTVNKS